MAALDLGFLLRGAGRALTGYRQGTREREEMERARQVEDAERMFKEWATKQQMERERARDAATVDYQNRTLAQQAARDAAAEASRKRDDERLTEEAVARRLGEGYETAIPETAQTAANAALSGLGMGQFGMVRTPKIAPKAPPKVGGVEFRPEETGDVQYLTAGGRMMRRDPQRAANAAAQEKADKLAHDLRLAQERERAQAASRTSPLDQRPTEAESKDFLFSEKVSRGQAIMDANRDKIDPKKVTAYLFSRWAKPVLTAEEQQFINGARHFASGVLRKETGAAVQPDELKDVWDRFIDAGLDTDEVRELKREAREAEMQALYMMSARARAYYERLSGQSTRPPQNTKPPQDDQSRQKAQRMFNRIVRPPQP